MKKLLLASALSLIALGASPAFAGGAFDFLDPCIKGRTDFADQRQEVGARYARLWANIDTMIATPEFRDVWLKAKRQQARPIFDKEVVPQLAKYGLTNMDQAFDAWFKDMISAVAPNDLEDLISTSFRMLAKEELARYRSKTESEFDQAKSDLDSSCKADVANQVLRVAVTPIGWVSGNIGAAKNEDNIVTQVFRGVIGISTKDVARNGLLGGENSEVRKGLRFLDPSNSRGMFGGSNSFFRKPFG